MVDIVNGVHRDRRFAYKVSHTHSAHAKDTARRHLFRAELGVLYILQGQADPSNETGLSIVSFNEVN